MTDIDRVSVDTGNAEEEESDHAGTGVGTDDVADIADDEFFRPPFLPDHINQRFDFFFAIPVADEDLPVMLPDSITQR